jgi:hypothetical protein
VRAEIPSESVGLIVGNHLRGNSLAAPPHVATKIQSNETRAQSISGPSYGGATWEAGRALIAD